jgi:hypothetical protein
MPGNTRTLTPSILVVLSTLIAATANAASPPTGTVNTPSPVGVAAIITMMASA